MRRNKRIAALALTVTAAAVTAIPALAESTGTDGGSVGGWLVLIWLLVWGSCIAGAVWAMNTSCLFRPERVSPRKLPDAPGFEPMAVYYAPQKLGQPAPQASRLSPVQTAPPKVSASPLGWAAFAAAAFGVAVPLFLIPQCVAMILGGLGIRFNHSTATRRLSLAALVMAFISFAGNVLMFSLV
ncbi:MAG: hypothetical protein ACI4OL_02295 [Gemmiger sp.]